MERKRQTAAHGKHAIISGPVTSVFHSKEHKKEDLGYSAQRNDPSVVPWAFCSCPFQNEDHGYCPWNENRETRNVQALEVLPIRETSMVRG
ncbi:hypothetical protein N7449_012491 [Penicillium cf. viridicatum]|uniref:Uncharacterized protein n=1 Tax=Penicillium cf. viridicatum TaxID=2972119 RepID=A0A9W9IQX1_9EURO|nr:hypothetical protein N7449_012491 [Penicillium cf. viridicatum]